MLHVQYTARDGGQPLEDTAALELVGAINAIQQSESEQGLARLFSLRHEFPTEWYRFLNPTAATSSNSITLSLTKGRFPFLFQSKTLQVDQIEVYVKVAADFLATHNESNLTVAVTEGTAPTGAAMIMTPWNDLLFAEKENIGCDGTGRRRRWGMNAFGAWRDVTQRLDPAAVEDICVICRYTVD